MVDDSHVTKQDGAPHNEPNVGKEGLGQFEKGKDTKKGRGGKPLLTTRDITNTN
jgi:hypothetical protein